MSSFRLVIAFTEFSEAGCPSSAQVPAESTSQASLPGTSFSNLALNNAAAIGERQMFAVQTNKR
jgi:hypothetical protein